MPRLLLLRQLAPRRPVQVTRSIRRPMVAHRVVRTLVFPVAMRGTLAALGAVTSGDTRQFIQAGSTSRAGLIQLLDR